MIPGINISLLIFLLASIAPVPSFASGYHVYDWKGAAKVKDGTEVRESKWQPGFVVTGSEERRVGDIMVTAINGRITEIRIKGDGKRRQTYATGELKEFGLLLSIADIEENRGGPKAKFGPGILELSDGQRLQGMLGAATLEDGGVYAISYARDRNEHLTSFFSRSVRSAAMTIDGIELEYLSSGDGISKLPKLVEYQSFNHEDESRNPHDGILLLPDGERLEGQVLLIKDANDAPALGAMLFDEDGYGVVWIASELARVTQLIDGQQRYWSSYGANLERLPTLQEYGAERHRDASRNAHPGEIVLRNGQELQGSVAFAKTRNDVNSIEVFYFDEAGVPFSYGGSDVVLVTQKIDKKTHRYFPYHDLVFVELLAPGQPCQIHANPFPEREDQFKTNVTRGLLSALLQGAGYKLGQEGLGEVALLGVMGCESSGTCSSRNSLRDAVEAMVPTFKKDEFVFRRANGEEVVLIKKTFDDEIRPLLEACPGYQSLPRKDRRALRDFDHPDRAVAYLNNCENTGIEPPPVRTTELTITEPGTEFRDVLKSGDDGPPMVTVPAGNYLMGDQSVEHSNEIPVHRVRFGRPFAVSRYEITLEEFDKFTASTGRVRRAGQLSKQPRSPARGIAWIDAVAYSGWLSRQTGYRYRLPTEAEWEYIARAGSITVYPWGEQVSPDRVLCEACGDKKPRSEDVGQYPQNDFGLFDTIGNVWEWVADCWHPDFSGAPDDGSAWMSAGDCNLRVVRGGSVENGPEHLRASVRTASNPVNRGSYVGFRMVREF